MQDELEAKKPPRLAGSALRVAAWLLETPGLGAPLHRMATRQLGIDQLRTACIPADVPPFRFTHLGCGPQQPAGEGADA